MGKRKRVDLVIEVLRKEPLLITQIAARLGLKPEQVYLVMYRNKSKFKRTGVKGYSLGGPEYWTLTKEAING